MSQKQKYTKKIKRNSKKQTRKNTNIFTIPIKKDISIPKDEENVESIIWLTKKEVKINVPYKIKMTPYKGSLPHGLYVNRTSLDKKDMQNMYKIFNHMFNKIKEYKIKNHGTKDRLSIYSYNNPNYGKSIDEPSRLEMLYKDVISHINQYNKIKNLSILLNKYIKNIFDILEIDNNSDVINQVKLTILRYKSGIGIPAHIDNISSKGLGPIITMSIGPNFIYYDMIPIFIKNKKTLRVKVNSGDCVIMDGNSRYAWAHSLPYGHNYNGYKYTIKLSFPKIRENKPIYNSILRGTFSTSMPN
jgi:hypothetical protein